MSWVTVKVPYAAEPLACMRRSGITSRSKWASFSRNHTSCSSSGPRGPAVITFWLSGTGAPAAVVSFFFSLMWNPSLCLAGRRRLGVLAHALCAQASHLDVRVDDTAELLHGVGNAKGVEVGAVEVTHQAAAHA